MKKNEETEKIIHCFECEKEKDGWCYLYERVVYKENFCDYAVEKSKKEELTHENI